MSSEWIRQNMIVWEELGSETVLVNPAAKTTWVLNETASFIWKHCNGQSTIDEIARSLAAAGGNELRNIRKDMISFCKELERAGMLVAVSKAATRVTRSNSPTLCFAAAYSVPFVRMQRPGMGFRGRPSSRGISGGP